MQERELNISFNKSGNGTYTPRISLPIAWVREMGIDQDNRKVNVTFEDGEIRIKKSDE
ncbi:MAG: PemI [Clostridium sp.]